MAAIFRREFSSYFTSPIGYVFLAVFYLFSGYFFYGATLAQGTTDMSGVFSNLFLVFVFLIPLLTMRLISEELKQKTDQALLTAPLSLTGLVVGKFLAAFAVMAIGISVLLVYGLVLSVFAMPEWAMIIGNLAGLVLLGAAFISIGVFVSSLTENQLIAAVGSFAIMLVLMMIDTIASAIPVQFISSIVASLSFYTKYAEFTSGMLNFANVLFFLSVVVIFNFLTVRVLEKKRWG